MTMKLITIPIKVLLCLNCKVGMDFDMIRHDRDYHRKKAKNSSSHCQMYRKLRNYANLDEKRLNLVRVGLILRAHKNNR